MPATLILLHLSMFEEYAFTPWVATVVMAGTTLCMMPYKNNIRELSSSLATSINVTGN